MQFLILSFILFSLQESPFKFVHTWPSSLHTPVYKGFVQIDRSYFSFDL